MNMFFLNRFKFIFHNYLINHRIFSIKSKSKYSVYLQLITSLVFDRENCPSIATHAK
jgi:hypothetical protein